jgi:TonB family protein
MNPADEPIRLREIWPPGTLIKGDFVIDKRLGGGGFGTVYLARNRFMGTTCVIKRLHEQFASDPEFVRKFVNEGRAIRRLRGCPHIVEVEHMTQSEDGHLILVMEFVPGGDLASLMETRIMSSDEVIEYARQIALGLQAAHQAGLVHRDIKPQNVLIGQDSTGRLRLKLIDFGIAADHLENHQTSVMRGGSIGYAAPEQWVRAGKELDSRTDLYSLGATMYRMLTGQMPYPSVFDIGGWIDEVRKGPPMPVNRLRPDVPLELSNLIQGLLAVRPEDRPSDTGVVIGLLDAIKAHQTPVHAPTVAMQRELRQVLTEAPRQEPIPEETHEPVLSYYSQDQPAKSRLPWVIAAAAVGVLALLGAWGFSGMSPAPAAPKTLDKAQQVSAKTPNSSSAAPQKQVSKTERPKPAAAPPATPNITAAQHRPVLRRDEVTEVKPAPPISTPAAAEKPEERKQPDRIRVGANIQAANLVRRVAPVYPALAKQARIQGTVIFSATIGKDGQIANLQVVSGHPLLVPAATDAVKQWVYKPTMLNGEPVAVMTQIDINFTLSDKPPPEIQQ